MAAQAMEKNKKNISSIAIFRALYLGDMLCILPVIRALKSAYPDARITLIGLPWQKMFVDRFPNYIDDFIEFPGWPGLPEQPFEPERILNFLHTIRERHFNLLLQMQGNGEVTNSMCMLWGADIVCGLRKPDEYCPDETLFPISEDNEHEILRFLKLVDALGIERQGTHLEFPLTTEETESFKRLSKLADLSEGNYICLHAGARDKRRRWSAENFAFIGDHLSEQGYKVVLTGSLEEKAILENVQKHMRYTAVNLVEKFGHLPLGDLAAFIRYSKMLFSNDTGVSHIAAALHTPSVIVFSPFSDIRRWAPLDASRHLSIPFEKAKDAEYVLYCLLDHLGKQQPTQLSPVLLN
jgi:ADP-heptose:LPS heptosyltransferase